MKNKKLILILIISILIISAIIAIIYIKNKNSVPYIFFEGNNQKVKAIESDLYEPYFNTDIDQHYSINEYYNLLPLNKDNYLDFEGGGISYFNVCSSNGEEFTIEAKIRLQYGNDVFMERDFIPKELLIKNKDFGNKIRVGLSKPTDTRGADKNIINVFKINFKNHGVHYYSILVN